MTDLETSPYPLVYPLVRSHETSAASPRPPRVEIRTLARALTGMQKEALATSSPNGRTWRMACDEGPYLNGTDLAPFPLAFFTTGLVNSYFVEILDLARLRGTADRHARARPRQSLHDGGLGRPRRHDRRRIAGCAARPDRCGRFRRRTQRSRRGRRGSFTCGCVSPRCVRERVLDREERRARAGGQRATRRRRRPITIFRTRRSTRRGPIPTPTSLATSSRSSPPRRACSASRAAPVRACDPSRNARCTFAVLPHCALTASPRRACSFSNRLAAVSAFSATSTTTVAAGALHRRSNISRPALHSATSRRSAATRRS